MVVVFGTELSQPPSLGANDTKNIHLLSFSSLSHLSEDLDNWWVWKESHGELVSIWRVARQERAV